METASLDAMLSDQPWRRRLDPFPHFFTTELFKPEVSEAISAAAVRTLADAPLSPFERYDAQSVGLSNELESPLDVFVSREWVDLLSNVLEVPVTNHVSGGLHHHHVGSADGAVHCDYNPVYFADVEPVNDVVLNRGDLVSYTTGKVIKKGEAKRVPVARAVAVLYYTGNDEWRPGDGGETGIYRHSSDPVRKPAIAVPPINNTLLVFECTPYSFHSFISNRRITRNAVVMWLHRSMRDVRSRWGVAELERWVS